MLTAYFSCKKFCIHYFFSYLCRILDNISEYLYRMKGHEMIDIEVVHRWDDASLKMLYSHFYKALVAFSA